MTKMKGGLNMKLNFKRIVPVLTGAILLGSTVGFATSVAGATVSYPSSFSDSVVVIGSASADAAAANTIAADLGKLTVSTTTASVSEGWLVKKSGEELNYGEDVYDIDSSIEASDLAVLADGVYKETKGNTDNDVDFEQYLDFFNGGNSIVFERNQEADDELTSTYLKMPKTTASFEYRMKFTDSPTYDNASSTTLKEDFELSKLNILGDDWTFTDASGTSNHPTKITLMGGASSATMMSGETKDFVVDGKTYSVAVTVYSGKAQFTINGESLSVDEGATDELADETVIGVTEISTSSKESVADQVTFYMGARKLVLENGQEVELNGADVDGSLVTITVDTANKELDEIKVKYTPDDDTYVAVGQSFEDPVFGKFKFVLSGLDQKTEELKATTTADDGKLVLENSAGDSLELSVVDNDTAVFWGDDLIDSDITSMKSAGIATAKGNMVVNDGDWCLAATDLSGCEGVMFLAVTSGGEARVIEINDVDIGAEEMDFKDLTTNKEISNVEYANGSANLDLGFMIVNLTTGNASGDNAGTKKRLEFTNINSYADVAQGFETALGGKVMLGAVTTDARVHLYQDTDHLQIGNFTFGVASDGDMELDDLSSTMYAIEKDSDQKKGLDLRNWGAIFDWDSEDKNDLTITYPEEKVIANVYVAPTSAIVSGAGVVPVVKDTELGTSKTSKDLVVVGGPAINKIAAELMGLTFPTYGADAGFKMDEAMITLYEGKLTPGKVALLVAGYEAKDTAAAAKALVAEKKFGTLKTATASAYEYA
jgi:Rieske Fe-S protein